MSDEDIAHLLSALGVGVGALFAAAASLFGAHWMLGAIHERRTDSHGRSATQVRVNSPSTGEKDAAPHVECLELRGVGVVTGAMYQSGIWSSIRDCPDNFSSLYSSESEECSFPLSVDDDNPLLGTSMAFEHAAAVAVAYWPVPAFVVEPPCDGELISGESRELLAIIRQRAQLHASLFLRQSTPERQCAQREIAQLFQFFEEHTEVPQALIAACDGDALRGQYEPGNALYRPQKGAMPVVLESTAALLVARSERVDRHLRSFAPDYPEESQDQKTDMGKLWAHFWETEARSFSAFVTNRAEGRGGSERPHSFQTNEWQAVLPELWATIDNRGPGRFEPTPWLPVRWAKHQVDEFDRAPKLGHLHRPVKVALRDEQGRPLKAAMQVKAMMAGWEQALATLPNADKPVRVFYDSTNNMDAAIALNNTLHALNTDDDGLDLSNVDEGYDIGRRLWNLGVGSTLTQIGLAAIASYKEGGVTAVVYSGDEGSVSIQMVRPPCEDEKAHNVNYGEDPFMWKS